MKAPLRFAFGWVIYVALFAAVNPVVRAIADAICEQPLLVPVITALVGMVLLALLIRGVLDPFWHWCDSPRKRAVSGSVPAEQ